MHNTIQIIDTGIIDFLMDVDFDLLSSFYGVNAFPTYILLDKNGKIENLSAPRPSSDKLIIKDIQQLPDKM